MICHKLRLLGLIAALSLLTPAHAAQARLVPQVLVVGGADSTLNLPGRYGICPSQWPYNRQDLYFPAQGVFVATKSTFTSPASTYFCEPINAELAFLTATRMLDGRVLIAGGVWPPSGQPDNTVPANQTPVETTLYDPVTEAFNPSGNLVTERAGHFAVLLQNGEVLIAGGANSSGDLASAELYNPTSGSFNSTGSLTTTRGSRVTLGGPAVALLNNGQVLVAGGDSTGISAELYNPTSGSFTPTGNLTTPRGGATATLLPNGQVLIVGGDGNFPASAEVYDPSKGTFSATGASTTNPRRGHTATLLNNGLVLVVGGFGGLNETFFSAELYNPRTRTFSATGNTASGHTNATATLLPSGQVLVVGGTHLRQFNGNTYPLSNAESYDPKTGTFSPAGNLSLTRSGAAAVLIMGQ
jgi:hypothetical protein